MKNLTTKFILKFLIMISIFVGSLSSCSSDDNDSNSTDPNAVPVINTVFLSEAGDLEETSIGYPRNYYIIDGSGFTSLEKVFFNELDTYFNPTLITDSKIIVNIDENTPYENASNELRIITAGGTAVYPFVIAPPAPSFSGFNPVNAADGETVIIKGSFFLDPVVTVGGVQATVVSNTLEEIEIILPTGSNHQYITVTTISGDGSSTYAIGTALYDDVWYGGFEPPAWNNHTYESDGTAQQGETYFKKDMGGWGNIQGEWSWFDQIAPYSGIHFYVRADSPGKLKFVFNGNWDDVTAPNFEVTTEWTEISYTWADLLNADHVQNITFQEFTGDGGVYHFDNFGYTLN